MASEKGCFVKLLTISLVLLIILIVLGISLYFLAVGHPTFYPAPKFDVRDKTTVAGIITRLARSLVDKEGRVVETAVLKLSPNEVQTLVNAAVRGSNDYGWENLSYSAVWNAGHMEVRYSSIFKRHQAVNFQVDVIPSVDNGILSLVPVCGSAGRLPLPGVALNFAAEKLEQMAMGSDSVRTTLSAFKRIEPGDDGTLVLMFDPRDVNTVVRILRSAGEEDRAAEDDGEDDDDAEDRTEENEE